MKNLRLGQCFLFDSSVSRLTRALADMDAPAQAGSLFVFVGLWPYYCASAVPALSQETEHRAHASDILIRAARERTLSHVFSFFFRPREHVSLSIVFKVVHGMVACARASDREGPTLFNLKLTRPPGRGLSFVFQSFRLIFSRVKSLVRIDGPSLKPFLGSHGFFFV